MDGGEREGGGGEWQGNDRQVNVDREAARGGGGAAGGDVTICVLTFNWANLEKIILYFHHVTSPHLVFLVQGVRSVVRSIACHQNVLVDFLHDSPGIVK